MYVDLSAVKSGDKLDVEPEEHQFAAIRQLPALMFPIVVALNVALVPPSQLAEVSDTLSHEVPLSDSYSPTVASYPCRL